MADKSAAASLVMSVPPSREEIIDFMRDPSTGDPIKNDALWDTKSDRFLLRCAELHGERFTQWLRKERLGQS